METKGIETYRNLLEETFAWKDKAAGRLKGLIHCAKGCSHCCNGLFYVTYLDLMLLLEGWKRLPSETQVGVLERSRSIKEKMKQFFGIESFNQLDDHREDIFYNKFKDIPCPFLSLEQGSCMIYPYRTYICRLQGVPFYDGKQWDNDPCCDFNTSLLPMEKDPANQGLFFFDEGVYFEKEKALFGKLGLEEKSDTYYVIPDIADFIPALSSEHKASL